jgi:hypothetical protein
LAFFIGIKITVFLFVSVVPFAGLKLGSFEAGRTYTRSVHIAIFKKIEIGIQSTVKSNYGQMSLIFY